MNFPFRQLSRRPPRALASRRLVLEPLESRQLLNVDWRNPVDALDANADGRITPRDVLVIVNELNSRSEGTLPAVRPADANFCDVTGDNFLSAQDPLAVINALNAGLFGLRQVGSEAGALDARIALTIGQPTGVRIYSLRIDGTLANSARLGIYLVDPSNPALPLLNSGPPGSALFEWSNAGTSYPPDYVNWDGNTLTLALPNFANRSTGDLRIEYAATSESAADRLTVVPLTNIVDTTKSWPPFAQPTTIPLTAHLAAETDPNGNNVVLRPNIVLEGQTVAGATVQITGEGGSLTATADAQGHYSVATTVAPGDNAFHVAAADTQGRTAAAELVVRYGDVVLDWNAAMLTVVRDWTSLSNDPYPNRVVLSPPPAVARNLAMVHAAIYDAINAVEGDYQPYQVAASAPQGTSAVVAAAVAAQIVASQLYTGLDERSVFTASLVEALQTVPDGAAKDQGMALGQQVGNGILDWRRNDGAGATRPYVPGTLPGQWQRTFPDYFPPLLTQWPGVKPFAMTSPEQFRAPPPPALDSAEYAAAVDELQRLGGFSSTERTAEQTEIAIFWADGGGTFTPTGHWNQIAADVSLARGQTLSETARTFAMLNVAAADAGISCWDSKYFYNFWRPIDAIRKAADDGNPLTTPDPNWIPLIRTPNFPSYTSGHSTFSAAAAAILTAVFGDNVAFISTSDQHSGFSERPLADHLFVTRSFTSFNQAAKEASLSRLYGGIHYVFDNQAGLASGAAIGQHIVANFFQPLP